MTQNFGAGRVKQQKDRKRKRMHAASRGNSQEADLRADSRQRTESTESEGQQQSQEVSLLFRMENGESVEIPIPSTALPELSVVRAPSSDRANKDGIAEQVRWVRNTLMSSGRGLSAMQDTEMPADDTVEIRGRMDRVLATALKLLEKLDDVISNWTYPVTGSTAVIAFQRKLREDRAKTWRFIQACGTVARVVLRRPIDSGPRKVLEYFDTIHPAPRESGTQLERHEHFGYDFIKTVLLWLDSGVGAVLREFTNDPDDLNQSYRRRRPIPKDSGIDAIDALLIPYLSDLASSEIAITDIDADDFENSFSFSTEKDAVAALSRAMKIPFADLAGRAAERNSRGEAIAQDRETAVKFWAHRVCRAILRNAAIDVTYALVDTAFGTSRSSDEHTSNTAAPGRSSDETEENQEAASADIDADEEEDDDEDDDDDNESSAESSQDSEEDEDQEDTFFIPHPNSRPRQPAGKGVPTSSHTRLYRGHCNVETTKDVNFWGLHDEYVVSGSDCGNLFIWDRKTCELLNILEGDNEVVNVIQGHPYEPMLAVSGIDHTVKIFSPDARARKDAAMGIGIQPSDHSTFSSIGLRRRRETLHQRMNMRSPSQAQGVTRSTSSPYRSQNQDAALAESSTTPNLPTPILPNDDDDPDPAFETAASITSSSGLTSRKQMQNSYQIVSKNDMDRRRGARQGAFITRGMMQLLAQQFRAQLAGQVEGANLAMGEDGEGGGDGEMEAEEGCAVM
jgi:nuclear receptor interaction protein